MVDDALEQDDASLVRAAQAGDPEAFAHLFRRHYPTVRRVCARRLVNGVDADEVTQAAFVRAYERLDQCAGDRRFGAWVQVIALRLCGDTWRAGSRTTPMADPAPSGTGGPDPCVEALLRTERAAAVRCALATLPPRQREVIVARYLEGRRPRDVAAALAVSVGTVDSLLLRARRRMLLACRASGVEQGAASTSVATTSLAAGSAAAELRPLWRPLSRLAETVSGALDAAAAGLAGALGLGPVAPVAAHKVAGLVGAGALLLAPLASTAGDPPPPPPTPVAAAPAVSLGVADGLATALPVALPPLTVPPLTVPPLTVPPLTVPALAVPALPVPGVPAGPSPSLAPVLAGVDAGPAAPVLAPVDAGALLAGATAAVRQVAGAVTATVGGTGVASAAEQVVGALAGLLGLTPAPSPAP